MQSFGTSFGDSKLTVLLALVVAVIAIAIVIYLYRLTFARQLHMTGARSRQPRLGVVDAFDLDKQRQLILVRRDNVEHLLMIGGPNDVLIESAFVRGAPMAAMPAGRDRDAGGPPLPAAPTLQAAAGSAAATVPAYEPVIAEPEPSASRQGEDVVDLPLAPRPQERPAFAAERPIPGPDLPSRVVPGDLGPLADLPAPGPVAAPPVAPASPPPPFAAEPVTSAEPAAPPQPPPSARPTLNRPFAPPPRPAGASLPPRPPLSSLRPATTPPRPSASAPPPNRPAPFTPLQRGTSAASLRREPVGGVPTPAAAPSPLPPLAAGPTSTPADTSRPPIPPLPPASTLPVPEMPSPRAADSRPAAITLESIESLEEEMAKLLGRGSTPEKR